MPDGKSALAMIAEARELAATARTEPLGPVQDLADAIDRLADVLEAMLEAWGAVTSNRVLSRKLKGGNRAK